MRKNEAVKKCKREIFKKIFSVLRIIQFSEKTMENCKESYRHLACNNRSKKKTRRNQNQTIIQ